MQVAVGQVEDPDAPLVLAEQPVDPGAGRQRVLLDAKCSQDGETGRLQQQARSHGMRLLEAFQHCDTMPGIGEKTRSGLSDNTAANDPDLKRRQRHSPF